MAHKVELGFQSNQGGAVSFFNLTIDKDGKEHKVANLLDEATNGGKHVKVPNDFVVSEVLLSKPQQLAGGDKVHFEYPSGSGSNVGAATLSQNKTTEKFTTSVANLKVRAEK